MSPPPTRGIRALRSSTAVLRPPFRVRGSGGLSSWAITVHQSGSWPPPPTDAVDACADAEAASGPAGTASPLAVGVPAPAAGVPLVATAAGSAADARAVGTTAGRVPVDGPIDGSAARATPTIATRASTPNPRARHGPALRLRRPRDWPPADGAAGEPASCPRPHTSPWPEATPRPVRPREAGASARWCTPGMLLRHPPGSALPPSTAAPSPGSPDPATSRPQAPVSPARDSVSAWPCS